MLFPPVGSRLPDGRFATFSRSVRDTPDIQPPDYSHAQKRRDEWDLLGLAVGQHPIADLRPELARQGFKTSKALPNRIGKSIKLGGLVAAARTAKTKKGRHMCFVTLSDEDGLFEATLFPEVYDRYKEELSARRRCRFLWVAGKVEAQYDALSVTVDKIGALTHTDSATKQLKD